MAIHSLQRIQRIPATKEAVWAFISTPMQLQTITPDYMNFTVLGGDPGAMYPGQIIQYKVSPVFHIPLQWCTEITHVKEGEFFVDEQRKGPYKFWHHQHHIHAIPGGTEMLDIVHYEAPMGFLGEMITPWFITPKLEAIFDYRYQKIVEIFGTFPTQA